MRIVCLDGHALNPGDNPWDPVEALGELTVYDRTPRDQRAARASGAEAVLTNKTPIDAELLEQVPGLKFVGVLATGYNVVDIDTARRRGVRVCNVPDYSTDSVAQFTFALLLELCHHVGRHDAAVHTGEWTRSEDFCFWKTPQVELFGKRMGIVGFGRIGRRVGRIAHAMGMEVVAATRTPRNPPAYEPFAWREVEEVFAEADVVSLHCPLTDENEEFVNAELLRRMKPSGMLINTARGGLIREVDLADALNAGRIAGAGVDVVSAEPIAADNPLLNARNCVITPHIAWASLAARKRLMQVTADNLRAFQEGKPIHVVC